MAIRKNFTKVGNSAALVIDRNIMDLLNMDSHTPVEITLGTDGASLILRPVRDEEANDRRIEAARKESLKRHSGAFKKLADR